MIQQNKKRKKTSRKLFTAEEDSKLIELYRKYKDNWKMISKEMKNRSVRQCKERYYHYLSPNINRQEWTTIEDALLLLNIQKYGKKWKLFESIFPGRTEINIRNRYNIIYRRIMHNSRVQSK